MRKTWILALCTLVVGFFTLAPAFAEKGGEGRGKGRKGGGPGEGGPQRGGGQHFEAMDTDGNGSISLQEFKAAHAKRVEMMKERMGDRWDPDRAAQRPGAEEIFKKMDANADGELTKEEMAQAREKMRGQRGGRGGPGKGRPGGGRGKGGPGGGGAE